MRWIPAAEPLPESMVTSSPSCSKYPLIFAMWKNEVWPSNFQSSEKRILVKP